MSYMDQDLPAMRSQVETRRAEMDVFEERLVIGGEPTETSIILALDETRAYYVTQQLERFDRELRRTAARQRKGYIPLVDSLAESLVASRVERGLISPSRPGEVDEVVGQRPKELRASYRGTHPDSPQASGLRLVASEPGSSLMLLAPLGPVVAVLASDPMTAIANAAAWSGPIRRIRGWFTHNGDALRGITARQALDVLSEFGGAPESITGRPADQTIELDDAAEPIPGVHAEAQLPDGTVLRGRRIHVIQEKPDGSRSMYTVD